MALILTQQIPPPGIPGIFLRDILFTAGSLAQIVDGIDTIGFHSVKWIVTVNCFDLDLVRMFEVSALHRGGVNPIHTVFGDIGDRIRVGVDVTIQSGKLSLQLINNSGEDITINVVRIQVVS
jgi:hypothetical protein